MILWKMRLRFIFDLLVWLIVCGEDVDGVGFGGKDGGFIYSRC